MRVAVNLHVSTHKLGLAEPVHVATWKSEPNHKCAGDDMTDRIEPALSAEEWEAYQDTRLRAGDLYVEGNSRARWEDYELPPTTAGAIAILNHELPNSDPGKITRAMVQDLRESARLAHDALKVYGPEETWGNTPRTLAAMADRGMSHAAALESYLPPPEPTV